MYVLEVWSHTVMRTVLIHPSYLSILFSELCPRVACFNYLSDLMKIHWNIILMFRQTKTWLHLDYFLTSKVQKYSKYIYGTLLVNLLLNNSEAAVLWSFIWWSCTEQGIKARTGFFFFVLATVISIIYILQSHYIYLFRKFSLHYNI